MKQLVVTVPVDNELYCFDASKIQVIDRYPDIVPLPYSNQFLKGLANIRGEVLPVISFRKLLNLEDKNKGISERILIFEEKGLKFGMLVDNVQEILDISGYEESKIDNTKTSKFITKVFKFDNKLLLYISCERVIEFAFSINEIDTIKINNINEDNIKKEKINEKKFVTFLLDEEEYGFELSGVKEIIRYRKITYIPDETGILKGIISLRESILPIIDLKSYLKISKSEIGNKTRIIVIDVEGISVGLMVDEVKEVLSIDEKKVSKVPEIISESLKKRMKGIINIDDGKHLIVILNTELLFDEGLKNNLKEISNNNQNNVFNDNEINRKNLEKYLLFGINNHLFALNILSIIEINRVGKITPVFELSDFVKGFMNLRGEVISVIDTSLLFYGKESKITDKSRVIIGQGDYGKIALLVDFVKEVLNVDKQNIDSTYFNTINEENRFFKSVIKFDNRSDLIIVINEENLKKIKIDLKKEEEIKGDLNKIKNDLESKKENINNIDRSENNINDNNGETFIKTNNDKSEEKEDIVKYNNSGSENINNNEKENNNIKDDFNNNEISKNEEDKKNQIKVKKLIRKE